MAFLMGYVYGTENTKPLLIKGHVRSPGVYGFSTGHNHEDI